MYKATVFKTTQEYVYTQQKTTEKKAKSLCTTTVEYYNFHHFNVWIFSLRTCTEQGRKHIYLYCRNFQIYITC